MKSRKRASGLTKIDKISDNIIHLEYEDQESMCRTMVRISEYNESPHFKGKPFTLGEYREWYSKTYGLWTYYQDWSGFNVTEREMKAFLTGIFDPLTVGEEELIEMVRYKEGTYSIIATYVGCEADVYEHEICHALFHVNPEYRDKVTKLLKRHWRKLLKLREHLSALGYTDNIILDECHAYICESSDYLDNAEIEYPNDLTKKLKAIKAKYI